MGRGPDLKPRKPRAESIAGKDMIPPRTAELVMGRVAGTGADPGGSQLAVVAEHEPPIVKALGRRKVTADWVARRIKGLADRSYQRAMAEDGSARDIQAAFNVHKGIARLRGDWAANDAHKGANHPQIPPQIVVQLMQVLREDPGVSLSTVTELMVDNAPAAREAIEIAPLALEPGLKPDPSSSPSAPCPDADNVG